MNANYQALVQDGSGVPLTGYSELPRACLERVNRVAVTGPAPAACQMAANLLLTKAGGVPDAATVARVAHGGAEPLARWISEHMGLPADLATTTISSTAAELAERAELSVAEAIALRCWIAGIKAVFAYPGTSELSLCHAFAAIADGLLINARGDAEAVFMAGGSGAAGRSPGVAIVHGARGLTNAGGAVADLRRNEIPAVILVGLPSTTSARFLPPHGEADLIPIMGRLAKAAWQVDPKDRKPALDVIDDALASAAGLPAGPVLVGLPQDILDAGGIAVTELNRALPQPPQRPTKPRALRRARALIRGARSPVVLVDDFYLRHPGAEDTLAGFTDRLGAMVFQLRYRRGPMLFQRLTRQATPSFGGWHDPNGSTRNDQLQSADLLITIEDRNLYRRVVGELPTCPKIAITSDATRTTKNEYLGNRDIVIEGSPLQTLRSLTENLTPRPDSAIRTSPGSKHQPTADDGDAAAWLRTMLAHVIRGCVDLTGATYVVDDSQMVGGVLAGTYEEAFGQVAVLGDHGGFVGAGIPLATGIAITSAEPVLCLAGDQGFTNGSQGLICAGQESASVLYLVFNNGESVSLRKQSEAQELTAAEDFDRLLRNTPHLSYVAMARAAGIAAASIDSDDDERRSDPRVSAQAVITAAEQLWRENRPVLVEVRLPPHGPAWAGTWATSGLDESTATGRPSNGGHRSRWRRPRHFGEVRS